MTFNEVKGDLFTAPPEYTLCHCVSCDVEMGAGIAKTFRDIGVRDELILFDVRNESLSWYGRGFAVFTNCGKELERHPKGVFNLVTKKHYYDKPTLFTVREALLDAKCQMEFLKVNKLAMPRIGCGLDKLQWVFVKEIVKDVFKDTDVNILVFAI